MTINLNHTTYILFNNYAYGAYLTTLTASASDHRQPNRYFSFTLS